MNSPPAAWAVSAVPAPRLRTFIDSYLGYRIQGFPAQVRRGLPTRTMTLMISIGEPIEVLAQTDPSQPAAAYRAVVGGLQASPALIADPGDQEGIAIRLTPTGVRAVLGLPASELWNLSVELSDVTGPAGSELWERVQDAPGWSARFAACDDVLSRLIRATEIPRTLAWCWHELVRSEGTASVGALAARAGYSRQHLTRGFRREFGLSPKLAARVIRFDRAKTMLTRFPASVTIGQVAAECGYADQAHLVRDVRSLAGCSPSELMREAVPFVQGGAAATE